MAAMQVKKMFIFNDGFRVSFLFKIRFGPLHDDIGIVIGFHGITDEDLLVSIAEKSLEDFGRFVSGGGAPQGQTGREQESTYWYGFFQANQWNSQRSYPSKVNEPSKIRPTYQTFEK